MLFHISKARNVKIETLRNFWIQFSQNDCRLLWIKSLWGLLLAINFMKKEKMKILESFSTFEKEKK